MKKIILPALALLLVVAGLVYWRYCSPYQRNIINEKSVAITANEIIEQFKTNETLANEKYLNKVVSVTGSVSSIETGINGNMVVVLKSNDTTANVFCTLKLLNNKPSVGATVTVKGICTGFFNDIVLNEAVIVK